MTPAPAPTSGLFTALATVALILGMAYIITGITGLVRHMPTAPILTGFGVVVCVLALWLRRWATRRARG
jgi:hypothetical protein